SAEPTPAPAQKSAPLPQVPLKKVSGRTVRAEVKATRKTDAEPKKGASRLLVNENRFAEQINRAGGAFFTEFVARLFEEYYRSRGVTVCGRYVVDGSDDKGVDVILQTVDELGLGDVVLLQAKTRSSGQVTLKELREFYGVMAAEHADHGMFVTTSTFTTDAVTFARSHPDLAAVDKYKLFSLASRLKIGLIGGEGGALSVDPELFG
ncbi:MAG: restriction endonuclease, partial [Clostridia bacterium]|nr:restriction endonuclease [Clostridia bacterium]